MIGGHGRNPPPRDRPDFRGFNEEPAPEEAPRASMTLALDTSNELQVVRRPRWRVQPLRQIFFAWTGVLWAAPVVSVLAILVAREMHTWVVSGNPVVLFLLLTIYTVFVLVIAFSWNVIPLTFAIIFFARHRGVALGLAFWCALSVAHIFRFLAATGIASYFFSGLTEPGVLALDALCGPDPRTEFKFKCAELADIERIVFWVSACLSLVLFALDVRRKRATVRNSGS